MRLFALSDLHVDYETNVRWMDGLSKSDYRDDVLILAGDLTDRLPLLKRSLEAFAERFKKVLYVPGNHDLWVIRDDRGKHSLQKFDEVLAAANECGVSMRTHREPGLAIVPMLGWYDYSFGRPSDELRAVWMDFRACRWPEGFDPERIAAYFDARNDEDLAIEAASNEAASNQRATDSKVITFSHFLPRIDVMPWYIPGASRGLYPILGSTRIETRLRRLGSSLHVYGHSHVNRDVHIEGVRYVNNAFGYPGETWIASKRLMCIHER